MANVVEIIPLSQVNLCAKRTWVHLMKSVFIAGYLIEEQKSDLQIIQTGYLLENGCFVLEVSNPKTEKVICSTEFLPNEFRIKHT